MYRVMVVDDEPSALQHLCAIISKKCKNYHVVAQAENGEQALALMSEVRPDIVITDVRMPRMDGISLVTRLKAEYSETLTVIVSGFQDFEYAKKGIQQGVSDYLLKPLRPIDLQGLLERLELKLDDVYSRKTLDLMRAMCIHCEHPSPDDVEKYFTSEHYYAAILRRNGLPRRFSGPSNLEILTVRTEKVMAYGRDAMEMLCLCSAERLGGKGFAELACELYEDQLSPFNYVTCIFREAKFRIQEFPNVAKHLYGMLDECITIGRNQFVNDRINQFRCEVQPREKEQRELVEYLIRSESSNNLLVEMGNLVDIWDKAGHNHIYIGNQINHLLHLGKRNEEFIETYGSYTQLVDESLHYVVSMEELKIELLELIKILFLSDTQTAADSPAQLFETILAYMHAHMEEPLNVSVICRKFNISQTTLNRWFRKYIANSFNNYLSEIRITKAMQILQQNPNLMIKDVAKRVGYSDQFYFSRLFRSVAGWSPSDYVEKQRQGVSGQPLPVGGHLGM